MKTNCPYKDARPYLNFELEAKVLTQRNYLSRRVGEMERIIDLAREKNRGIAGRE